jgi:hypothetical protein
MKILNFLDFYIAEAKQAVHLTLGFAVKLFKVQFIIIAGILEFHH